MDNKSDTSLIAALVAIADALRIRASISVDSNGWTVYDFVLFKQYRLNGTFSASIGASTYAQQGTTGNLPAGMSTLGPNFAEVEVSSNSPAMSIQPYNVNSASTQILFTVKNHAGSTISYTAYWSVSITTPAV